MFFKPKFFYETNAENTGGGGTAENKEDKKVQTTVDVTAPLFTQDELKSFGFDTPDALKEHLRQHKENAVPEADKIKKANIEKANLIKYATEQNIANVDDFSSYESLSKKADADLVYEKFAAEQKEDNPELTDDEIKENFNSEYKLNSENAKEKERGQQKLAKEAKELRSPAAEKITKAQEAYKEYSSLSEKYPQFQKFIGEVIKKNTPDKLILSNVKEGEDQIPIEIEITAEQRKEISKMFDNGKIYRDYIDGLQKDKGVRDTNVQGDAMQQIYESHKKVSEKYK